MTEVVEKAILKLKDSRGQKLFFLPSQNHPFTGTAITLWPNGQKREEFSIAGGKMCGSYKEWYSDSKQLRIGQHENGEMSGKWLKWYGNGQLSHEINYADGIMDGAYVLWHDNGRIQSQGHYLKGKYLKDKPSSD